jgi:hypothetical protein
VSGGQICRCPESKKPLLERNWRVTQYRCNHSWFSSGRYAASDYSAIICVMPNCNGAWRTKAPYADALYARGKLNGGKTK